MGYIHHDYYLLMDCIILRLSQRSRLFQGLGQARVRGGTVASRLQPMRHTSAAYSWGISNRAVAVLCWSLAPYAAVRELTHKVRPTLTCASAASSSGWAGRFRPRWAGWSWPCPASSSSLTWWSGPRFASVTPAGWSRRWLHCLLLLLLLLLQRLCRCCGEVMPACCPAKVARVAAAVAAAAVVAVTLPGPSARAAAACCTWCTGVPGPESCCCSCSCLAQPTCDWSAAAPSSL